MILLWGVPGDGPLDAVAAALGRLGVAFHALDQRDAARSDVVTRVDCRGLHAEIRGRRAGDRLELDDVSAAYLRPTETRRAVPRSLAGDGAAVLRAEHVDRTMITWADLTTALVVNPPATMAANNSKPYQLRAIARHGFAVPDTLVTTDPAAVRAFVARHGRVIYKSVSGIRSIVRRLADTDADRLDNVANAPTQFQAWIPGVDMRVHVVGDAVFATEIRSVADDYRYASLDGGAAALAAVPLPDAVARRCRRMAAGMGLSVAGIDFRRTRDDRWVCFEVNPSPAFVYYEEATGQPIARAVAELMVHADAARRRRVRPARRVVAVSAS